MKKQVVVKTHPLAEILARCLFGIEGVPGEAQRRMVNRAIKRAVEWHENKMNERMK